MRGIVVAVDLERQRNLNEQTPDGYLFPRSGRCRMDACADGRLWHRRAVWMSDVRFCLRTHRSFPPPNANATASNCPNRWNRYDVDILSHQTAFPASVGTDDAGDTTKRPDATFFVERFESLDFNLIERALRHETA